jgi:hypothetical protein
MMFEKRFTRFVVILLVALDCSGRTCTNRLKGTQAYLKFLEYLSHHKIVLKNIEKLLLTSLVVFEVFNR